jgi:hypothetical protein
LRRPSFSTPLRGAAARLSEGLPVVLVAAFAALVLAAILVAIATRGSSRAARGFAEVTLSPTGCSLDVRHQVNATGCDRLSASSYRVRFTTSLRGSTVVAGRGSCCAGPIGASIETDKSVLIALPRKVTEPIRASVIVP